MNTKIYGFTFSIYSGDGGGWYFEAADGSGVSDTYATRDAALAGAEEAVINNPNLFPPEEVNQDWREESTIVRYLDGTTLYLSGAETRPLVGRVADLMLSHTWDVILHYMQPELREQVHDELAPCSPPDFLARYLELDAEFDVN